MVSKTIFGAIGVAAALGIGGTAWATTGSTPSNPTSASATPAASGSSTTPAGSGSTGAAKHRARSLLQRADHATVELKVKGQWVTYSVDRGQVSAVSPTSITIARPDGQSVTEKIDQTTKYRGVTGESTIKTGQPAQVVSDNGTAIRIRQGAAAANDGSGTNSSSQTGTGTAALGSLDA